MSVEKHIAELLYDHDCVIVPSLGGFLASNEQARLLPERQLLLPPFRKIAFNVYLKQNDGLLASHLVEYEMIGYQQALVKIEEFVVNCFRHLEEGRSITLPQIGVLSYDRERNLQFEPLRSANFRKESFGMDPVHLRPARKETGHVPVMKEFIPLKKKRPVRKAGRARLARIAGGFAVAAAATWFAINLYLLAPKEYNSSSLNPFTAESLLNESPEQVNREVIPEQKTETVYVAAVSPEETTSVPEDMTETVTEIEEVVPPKPEVTAPVPTVSESASTVYPQGSLYVITGVFRVRENAETHLGELHSKGFNSAGIIEANRCYYVYADGYTERSSALALLRSVKESSLSGWIWKH